MPRYRYKALDARGDLLEGQMDAASEGDVIARLQEQGHLPVEAKPATGSRSRVAVGSSGGSARLPAPPWSSSHSSWQRC